jgi:ribosomal-protein-alanine N-acetyltransferase
MLKSKRLSLRTLSQADWELISFLRTDLDVNKYITRSSAPTKEEAYKFISKIEKGINKKAFQYWVIIINSTDEPIGTICLWNYADDLKTAEIGYELKPQFQKKGYMSESLKMVIDYAFKTLNFQLIEAYTHFENKNSILLLEKNNFALVPDKKDEDNAKNVVYVLNAG